MILTNEIKKKQFHYLPYHFYNGNKTLHLSSNLNNLPFAAPHNAYLVSIMRGEHDLKSQDIPRNSEHLVILCTPTYVPTRI